MVHSGLYLKLCITIHVCITTVLIHVATVQNRNQHIPDKEKREYAAMVTQVDDGVGAISDALARKNMWNNTVFIFISDHGASVMPNNCVDTVGGSNLPFRDGKGSYFEGGIKSAAFVSTPWLTAEQKGMRSPALLHAVDIYSFIIAAAEDKLSGSLSASFTSTSKTTAADNGIDSGDYLIDVIRNNHTGRETVLHNLVTGPLPLSRSQHYCSSKFSMPSDYAVLRHKNFKLFYGDGLVTFCQADFLQKQCSDILQKSRGEREAHMLFDLEVDPYETTNVASANPEMVKHMISIIEEYKRGALNAWM